MEITILENEQSLAPKNEQFAMDVLMGFCSTPKKLSAKYFYDDKGSELFQKITQHEDYYPTRTEFEILQGMKDELPKLITDEEIDIIELGAGDGHKSQLLLNGFLEAGKKVNFFPVDISDEAMVQLEETIKPHQNLHIHGVVSEYLSGLRFLRNKSKNRQLVLFLGSNIGNFDRIQNQGFLRQLWKSLNQDDFALIGFDLKKDVEILTAAYNDSSGYTKNFNLNLLTRINRELGANFDVSKFQHFGVYNPILGAMESYLLPKEEQVVYIKELERSFHFEPYESIHLEYSFKFLKSDIEFLCEQTGFLVEKQFSDNRNYFADSLWRVKKEL
jgi:L-histidine N-alpha-methyltransferase